jgi:hypothetical protein
MGISYFAANKPFNLHALLGPQASHGFYAEPLGSQAYGLFVFIYGIGLGLVCRRKSTLKK